MRKHVWLVGLLFFGCDDGGGGGDPDTAPRGGDRDADGCVQGTARCNGNSVEICVEGQFADQGPCPEGQVCAAGACVPEACEPACDGKVCGPDGCGASCGDCGAGEACDEQGQCKSTCGDGMCANGETCGSCAEDCACGEGFSCQGGMCVQFCTPDCEDRTCGADGCGGNCGVCDEGQSCTPEGLCMDRPDECGNAVCDAGETCSSCAEDCACGEGFSCQGGQCVAECVRDCTNRICGPDGCGGSCGDCNEDQVCNERGLCADPPADCGDDVCDPEAESCLTCPADCGVCCGDGACTANHGENCASCAADCGCPEGEQCDPNAFRCVAGCQPDCAGRVCGGDGCGGVCGACADDEFCDGGACADAPAQCGDDACEDGEDCQNCPADCGACCGDRVCKAEHDENCATCLADCGCDDEERCDQGTRMCVPACVPDCTNRRCGDNGCGGSCGMCNGDQVCVEGACQDPPADCGDEVCEDAETCANCPADCGICCGDGECEAGQGENCATCLADCACEDGQACDAEQRQCVEMCVPRCGGRVCGPNGCGGNCGLCANGFECNDGRCDAICVPDCDGKACGADGCGGVCGECEDGALCNAGGQCLAVGEGCDCQGDEVCLDGFCRAPADLCDGQNPVGLCPIGQACLDGECVDRGAGCSPGNQAGVCPRGELCRNGACEPLDESALCDDDNACTVDRFDAQRNRCVHVPRQGACDDGNACTSDMCNPEGECVPTPIPNCLAPPEIGPYVTPTNEGELTLTGTKPAGSSIEINDQVAVPDSPEEMWQVEINLVPGENVFEIKSVDRGEESESITVRIIYDIEAPVVEVSPCGGIYRDGVTITAAGNEAADIYFTTDGGMPTRFDSTFFGAQAFRVFEDTTLRFIAQDRAGNWSEAETRCDFEVTGYGNRWNDGSALMESLSLAAVTSDEDGSLFIVGGTDGDAAQAGAMRYVPAEDAWSNLPSLAVDRAEASAVWFQGNIYVFGGRNEDIPLNFNQRLNPNAMGEWVDRRAMPTTRFGLGTAVVGNNVYAFGGKTNGGVVLDTAERYAPASDAWTNEISQLPRPRYAFATAVVGSEIFLIGGEDEAGNPIAEVDVYHTANDEWRQAPDLPTPRSFLSADVMINSGQVHGGHTGIVVAGGRLAGGAPTPIVEELLIERDVWRTRTPLPAPRLGHGSGRLYGQGQVDSHETQLWIVGGQVRDALTTDLSYYTQSLDYTSRLVPLPEGRFLHAAVPWAGRIYLFGGRNFAEVREGWVFDPETERFRDMPPLPSFQNGLAAAQVGGRLYAIGGANNFGLSVPTNRSIDPATGNWVDHRPMQSARRDAAIAVLNGEIWLIGGDNNGPLQSVEIYTPATDRWRNGPLLPAGRRGARAIVRNGGIYLIGGEGENGIQSRVLRLPSPDAQWGNYGASIPIAYASVAPVHDDMAAIIGGRDANGPVNLVQRWNWRSGQLNRVWLEPTQLGEAYDRAAVAALNGRIYVFGGNANPDPGPEGVTTIQTFDTQCLNGIVDPGEGLGQDFADAGGACGRVSGCPFLDNPIAEALARCRADGFTCQSFNNTGVRGWRNGAGSGSNCSPGNWRFYCARAGGQNEIDACTTCPHVGAIIDALSPCSCNSRGRLLGNWCEP